MYTLYNGSKESPPTTPEALPRDIKMHPGHAGQLLADKLGLNMAKVVLLLSVKVKLVFGH